MTATEQLLTALGDWRGGRNGTLAERLASGLAALAMQGAMPDNGRLPAERILAGKLGVSRATVVASYQHLRERGMAKTQRGSGTVMRNAAVAYSGASSPALAALIARDDDAPAVIDLSVGAPVYDDLIESLQLEGIDLRPFADGHSYAPLGWPALRAAIAERLSEHGAPTTPEEVLVTSGGHEAIALAISSFASNQSRVGVESPGYPGALDAIGRIGGQAVAIERDAGGLRVDQLKRLLQHQHLDAVYAAPSCNNPTGGRTATHRREQLVALAAKHEFALVEDTVLDALSYDADPGPPLWSLAPERVMAAGSLSKTAWGGLRIGWLRAPRQVVLRLARLKGSLNLGVGAFDQLAALELLTRPEEEVAGRRRAQAFERMRTMAEALTREIPEWEVEPPHGGWSLWIALPSGSASAFVQAALRHGVAVSPGGGCGLNDEFPERIRICFGPEPDLLEDAARRLRGCWRAFDPQAPAVPAFV